MQLRYLRTLHYTPPKRWWEYLLLPDARVTNRLQFSNDEGKTWEHIPIVFETDAF